MPLDPEIETREARSRYNAQSSLLNLPVELWLCIIEYLEDIHFIILRSTCHDLRTFLASPYSRVTTFDQHRSLSQRYAEHLRTVTIRFLQASEDKYTRVCSACVQLHPVAEFSGRNLSADANVRVCNGREGNLHVCEHLQLTYDALQTGARRFWCGEAHAAQQQPMVTRVPYHVPHYIGPSVVRGRKERGAFLGPRNECVQDAMATEGDELMIRSEFVLLEHNPFLPLKTSTIVESLNDLRPETNRLCPHIDTPEIIEMLETRPYSDCPNKPLHQEQCTPCQAPCFDSCGPFVETVHDCGYQYRCTKSACQSSFFFYRLPQRSSSSAPQELDELILVVLRDLGPVLDATDPRWTAQMFGARHVGASYLPGWDFSHHRWRNGREVLPSRVLGIRHFPYIPTVGKLWGEIPDAEQKKIWEDYMATCPFEGYIPAVDDELSPQQAQERKVMRQLTFRFKLAAFRSRKRLLGLYLSGKAT